jgi:hypothetical protein
MKSRSFGLLLTLLASLALPAFAVERTLTINPPSDIHPQTNVHVEIVAGTTASDGEQIGFLQAEYSTDNGKTWVPVYAENLGKTTNHSVDFRTGAAGTKALVRVRAAFRGGKAGDVDFAGKPIVWGGSWGTWETPPARQVEIPVR